MTKSELIDRLALHFPQLETRDAYLAVKVIFDSMTDVLSSGDRIEIRGFGTVRRFSSCRTGSRISMSGKWWLNATPLEEEKQREPQTDAEAEVSARAGHVGLCRDVAQVAPLEFSHQK